MLAQLEPHPDYFPAGLDTREEDQCLRQSMDRFGILHPLIVYPVGRDRYRILDGYRRYVCARELGLSRVYCHVVPKLTIAEHAHWRFVIHDTVLPWTQADMARWKRRYKEAVAEDMASA